MTIAMMIRKRKLRKLVLKALKIAKLKRKNLRRERIHLVKKVRVIVMEIQRKRNQRRKKRKQQMEEANFYQHLVVKSWLLLFLALAQVEDSRNRYKLQL